MTGRGDQPIEAHWSDQLLLRPHEKNQVISLTGGAELKFQAINQLDADEIHFWLLEQPQPQAAQPKLQPDRMLARGNVKMDSPQLSGAVEQLEAWFQQAAPARASGGASILPMSASKTVQTPPPPSAGQPPPPNAGQPPDAAGRDHFEIFGRLLRVKLLLLEQGSSELSELNVDENVRFRQTQASDPSQQPIFISGDRLQVTDANRPGAIVRVLGQPLGQPNGQPAHFEGRGLGLTGSNLNLDRGANRLWIDGPGQMDVLMDRDLQGQPLRTAQPMQVRWQRKMNFDGVKATFEQSVVAVGRHATAANRRSWTRLQQPIHFAEAKLAAAATADRANHLPRRRPSWKNTRSIPNSNSSRGSGWRSPTWRSIGEPAPAGRGPGRIIRVGRGDNDPTTGGLLAG